MPRRAPIEPLRLRLDGDAALAQAEGRVLALERRAAALLALAAFEPGITRLRAATMLWPDSADPRRNLRQQLLRFRQQLGRALLEGEDVLTLAAGVVVEPIAHGTLLASHDYGDCEDFAAWLDDCRQRHRARWVDDLRTAVAEAEAAGDLDAALAAAERRTAIDTGSEDAWREVMRLHFLRGESAAGLAAFQRLGDTLRATYGTAPSPASTALAEALRQGERRPLAVAPTRSLPVTLRRPPRLAGREAEQAAALRAWSEGRAVLIEGEAGLGKSRLIAELTAGTGALVASARPGDAGMPYATLSRWLAPLLDRPANGVSAAGRAALSHLGPAAEGQAALAPLRPGELPAAVAELLQAHRIVAAALDDLHFADSATLELVAGLAAAEDPPRRWLFAQRPHEAPAAAQALRESLTELQRLTVVALAPLDEGAAAILVDALAIPGLDGAAMAPVLVRHSGGNPLFLLETLKQGLHDGSLARGELPRPASVGTLIDQRLQRLSEPAMALARVAAIAGVDFSIALAEAAIGQSAVQLAGAWQELQDAQVLRDEAFAHDLVADAALKRVPAVIARRVHGQCAGWLEAHGGEPARVASHWLRGGEPGRAGQAFMLAAGRAELAARLEEEAALLQQAADAFDAAGLPEARFDALCHRLRALRDTDFGDRSLVEVRALMTLAGSDAQRLRALLAQVGLLSERGQSAETVALGGEAMTLARRLGDDETAVRLACHMASALCRLGRADDALAGLLPLRGWVDAQSDPSLKMLWHGDWAASLGWAGRMREAAAAYDTAVAAARRAGLTDAEGRLLMNCAITLRQSGQFDRALAMARQGSAMSAVDSDDATHRLIAKLIIARDESETAHYDAALPVLEALLPKFEATGNPFWTQACRMVLAALWLQLGQFARAVPLLRDEPDGIVPWLRADRRLLQRELALATGRPLRDDAVPDALALLASEQSRGPAMRVRALRGQPADEVLAQAEALEATLRAQERFGALLSLQVHVIGASLDQGRVHEAAEAAASLLARMDEGYAPDSMYRAEAWLAAHRAFAAAGRTADAERALRDGTRWVTQHALPHVPPAFIDSFLQRNAVNQALLSAARGRG